LWVVSGEFASADACGTMVSDEKEKRRIQNSEEKNIFATNERELTRIKKEKRIQKFNHGLHRFHRYQTRERLL